MKVEFIDNSCYVAPQDEQSAPLVYGTESSSAQYNHADLLGARSRDHLALSSHMTQ
jgi:hypothetical protein